MLQYINDIKTYIEKACAKGRLITEFTARDLDAGVVSELKEYYAQAGFSIDIYPVYPVAVKGGLRIIITWKAVTRSNRRLLVIYDEELDND